MTSLLDVITELGSAQSGATIYAAVPFAPESAAIVQDEPDDGSTPEGLTYLLEVDLARNVLEVWSRWRSGKEPTPREAVRAIIFYGERDAYEPL